MRRVEAEILKELDNHDRTVTELAERVEKSPGWVSEVVGDLAARNLVDKNGGVRIGDAYEARSLRALMGEYDIEQLLSGKREEILRSLAEQPQTPAELELQGFASSTVYQALNGLETAGVLTETEDGAYQVTSDQLLEYLKATTASPPNEFRAAGQRIVASPADDEVGQPTAFSAFQRYGVDYYPVADYRYVGDEDLSIEAVLVHAVKFAADQKQMSICAVFYLHHRDILEQDRLWALAKTWDCVETWADLLAFLDQRDVQQPDRFPSWDEFISLAREYDVYPRGHHPATSLEDGLQQVGDALESETSVYLLGGANLILRTLKDTTKDIDVVVTDDTILGRLTETLGDLGYEERTDLERVYETLHPSVIVERQGFPRWDIFVDVVADALHLTEQMQSRVDETRGFGNLTVHLLAPGDIFLFKSITEREGDLEDAALLARQAAIDWDALFTELDRQESLTGEYLSFAVLDTLDILDDRYGISPPIHDRLVSHCLENALLVTLDEPQTIRDLRAVLEFPDHRIYNTLRRLEDEDRIAVDRGGKLNEYVRVE